MPGSALPETGSPGSPAAPGSPVAGWWRRRAVTPGVPRIVLPFAVVAIAFLLLPLVALGHAAHWSTLGGQLTDHAALQALWLSVRTAFAATVCCLIGGVPLAVLLARSRSRWMVVVKALVTVPLVIPPVVSGLALLLLFGRAGLLGKPLGHWGISIGFTTTAVVLAQTFVSMPFLVLAIEGALRDVDPRFETVAGSLGAAPSRVLATVTLPLVRSACVTGAALAFARSLGEYGATVTFAGSSAGITRTLPLQVYLAITSTGADSAVGMSLLLVAVALIVLILVWRWRPVR